MQTRPRPSPSTTRRQTSPPWSEPPPMRNILRSVGSEPNRPGAKPSDNLSRSPRSPVRSAELRRPRRCRPMPVSSSTTALAAGRRSARNQATAACSAPVAMWRVHRFRRIGSWLAVPRRRILRPLMAARVMLRTALSQTGVKGKFHSMGKRLTHVLLALIIALATTLPVGVRAMPMPAEMTDSGMRQHCPSCPTQPIGGVNPDKMPACQVLVCVGAVATLPTPSLLPGRIFQHVAYVMGFPVRLPGLSSAPDPFPPRRIALV